MLQKRIPEYVASWFLIPADIHLAPKHDYVYPIGAQRVRLFDHKKKNDAKNVTLFFVIQSFVNATDRQLSFR